MYKANIAKFSANQELKETLLATGDKMIVECSPYDKIWGNGLDIEDSLKRPIETWKG